MRWHPPTYACIHGHFYQPPRENPWLEAVEIQGSAAPYHDWNERITAECYAPNGAARVVNGQNKIIRILNKRPHQLQLRSYAALLAQGQRPPRLPDDP